MFSTQDLLKTLQAATTQSNQVLTQGANALQDNTRQAQELFTRSQEELSRVVTESAKLAGDRAATEYAARKALENTQTLFNLDPSRIDNEIAVSLNQANQAREAYAPARAEYDRLTQISFFEDPLGFLQAQLKLPQVSAQVNNLADAEDRALQNIQTRTQLLHGAKQTITANTADALLAQSQSQAQLDARAAQAKLLQSDAENRVRIGSSIMQQIQVADKINDNTRSTVQTLASIQAAEEARLARNEAREDRSIDRELRREQLRLVLDEKKAKQEEIDQMNDRLAAVSAALGRDPMTVSKLKMLRDKKEVQFWLDAADSGRFGQDLSSSVEFFMRKGVPEQIQVSGASMQSTATKLVESAAKYVGPIQAAHRTSTGKPMKDEDANKAAFEAYQRDVIGAAVNPKSNADMSSPQWDSTFNPYSVPIASFSRLIDASPELAGLKNNLVKQQFDTMLQAKVISGDTVTGAQQAQILDSIKWKILSKEVTAQKAAADIVAFYKAANQYNFEMNKQDLFGLQKIDRYQFSFKEAGRIDLFNPTEVNNALQRAARLETVRGMQNQNPLFPSLTPFPKF